jgi:UDP-N-acetylmuramoyl-tripeptide--D-alanyl-D-alanine ligase
MRRWDALQIAGVAGAQLIHGSQAAGPERVTIDSREAGPGSLFIGLPGERVDGGSFASTALKAGAWGVLVGSEHEASLDVPGPAGPGTDQAVLVADDPLRALQRLATGWRRALGSAGMQVIGVTGSTGKTSTKDLLLAILSPHRRTVASQANFNTEIGLPLQILAAPGGTEVLVLEMAMRGAGQIAELCEIAEPEVGVVVNVGPVHLELLGSIEAVAAAKAELIAALPAGGVAVLPTDEPLLVPHLRTDVRTLGFGPGGEVHYVSESDDRLVIDVDGDRVEFEVGPLPAHLRENLLAATAAACAVGVKPGGQLEFVVGTGRGRHVRLPGEIILIDGAYNANPMSMRAALDELAATAAAVDPPARRVAVLGDMLELGPQSRLFHEQVGDHAAVSADLLVTVGPLSTSIGERFGGLHFHVNDADAAAALVPTLLQDGDVVLVKASFGIGLKRVCEAMTAGAPA